MSALFDYCVAACSKTLSYAFNLYSDARVYLFRMDVLLRFRSPLLQVLRNGRHTSLVASTVYSRFWTECYRISLLF